MEANQAERNVSALGPSGIILAGFTLAFVLSIGLGASASTITSFETHSITTTGDKAKSVHAADVDGDQDMDVLAALKHEDTVAWYENSGHTAFIEHIVTSDADNPNAVYGTDVDGDGDTDILSASGGDDTVAWHENDGSEESSFTTHVISSSAIGADAVYPADIDGDGDVDIVTAHFEGDTVAWYENDGKEAFIKHSLTTDLDGPRTVHASDLNGDGEIDILSSSAGGDELVWFENDGADSPAFTRHTLAQGVGPSSVFATDLDRDGDRDVISAYFEGDMVTWHENQGTADPSFKTHVVARKAEGAASIFATDINGDGIADIVAGLQIDDEVAWYENNGAPDPSFEAHTISSKSDGPSSVYGTDLDGDRDTDIVSASLRDDTVAWHENVRSEVWPQFGLDDGRTSLAGTAGGGTGTELWRFSAEDDIESSPAVSNGTVYVGANDNRVYALDAKTGAKKWEAATNGRVGSSPAIWNGTVYVGSCDKHLYALDSETGSEQWSVSFGGRLSASPAVWNGTVYIGAGCDCGSDGDREIRALNATTGAELWSFKSGKTQSSPAIWNETVYFGTYDGHVYALDATRGTLEWRVSTGPIQTSAPAIWNGTVYIGEAPPNDGRVYAFNAETGTEKWRFDTGDHVKATPAVWNGTVYVGSVDDNVYALDAETGVKEWSTSTNGGVYSSPAVGNGTVYIGSADQHLYAIDATTGAEKWSFETVGAVKSSPSVDNGRLYVGSGMAHGGLADGTNVYALDAGAGVAPSPPLNLDLVREPDLRNITLSWDKPSSPGSAPLDHFNVYRGTSPNSLSKIDQTTNTSYTDTGLACDTEYFYEVTAVNENGFESTPTGTRSIVTGCPLKVEITDVEPSGGAQPDVETTVHLRVVNDGDHSLSGIDASATLVHRPRGSGLGAELVTYQLGDIPAGGSTAFAFQFRPDEPGQYTLGMAAARSLDDDGTPEGGASLSTQAQVNLLVEGATASISSKTFLSPCDEDFWSQDDFLLIPRPDCEKFGNDERVSFPNAPDYFLPGELLAVEVGANTKSPVDWSERGWSTEPSGVLSFVGSRAPGDLLNHRTLYYEVEVDLRHELGSQGRRQVSLDLELPLKSGEIIPVSADVPIRLSTVKFGFRAERLPAPQGTYRFSGLAMAAEDGMFRASADHWNRFSFHSKGWKQRETPIHATQGGGSVLDIEDTEWSCESPFPFWGCDSSDRLFRKAIVEGEFEEDPGQNGITGSSGTEITSKPLSMTRCSGTCRMVPPTVSVFDLRPVLLETSVPREVEKGERYALYLRVLGGNPEAPHAVFNVKAHLEADAPIRFTESGTDSITLSRFAAGGRAESQGSPAHFTVPFQVLDSDDSSGDITVTLQTRPRGSDEWLGPTSRSFSLELAEASPGTDGQLLDVYERRLKATEESWDRAAGKTMDTSWDGVSSATKTLVGVLAAESLEDSIQDTVPAKSLAKRILRLIVPKEPQPAKVAALENGIDVAFTIGETSGSAIVPHGPEKLRKTLPLPPTEEEFKKGKEVIFDQRKSESERVSKAANALAGLDRLQGIYQLSRIKTGSALHWAPAPANPDPFPPLIVDRDAAFGHAGTTSRCERKPNVQGLFSSPRPFFSHPAVQATQAAFSFAPSVSLQAVDNALTLASVGVDFATVGSGYTSMLGMHCVAQKGNLLPGSVQTSDIIGPNTSEQTAIPVHNEGSNLTVRVTRPAEVNLTINLTTPNGTDATHRLSTRHLNGSSQLTAEIEDASAGNWTVTVTAGPDANATWYTTYGRQTHPGLTPHTFRLLDPEGQPVPANLTLSADGPLRPVKKSIGRGTFDTKLPANASVNYTATAQAYAPLAGTLNASEIGNTTVQRLDPRLTFGNTTARFTNAPVWNHTVNVSNTGPADLELNASVSASGPLEAALEANRLNLSAGESEPLWLNTTSLGPGNHTAQLRLTDANTGALVRSTTLRLEGREAQLHLTPGTFRQAIEKGSNRTLNATVANVGNAPAPNLTVEHEGPEWLEVQDSVSDLPAGATVNLTVAIKAAKLENATVASTTVWVNHSFESRPVPVAIAAFGSTNHTTIRQGLSLPQGSDWNWNLTVNETTLSASIESDASGQNFSIGFKTEALRVEGSNGTVALGVENASLGRLEEGILLRWANETADRIVRVSVTPEELHVTPFVGIQNATFGANGLGLLEDTIRSGPDLLLDRAAPFLRLDEQNLTQTSAVQAHRALSIEHFRDQAPAVPSQGARVAGTVTYDGAIGTVLQRNESAVLVRHIEDAPAQGTEVSVRVTPRRSAALSQTLGDALGWTAIEVGNVSEPAPRVELASLDPEFEDSGNRRVSVLGEVTATNATHRNLTVLEIGNTTGPLFSDWSTVTRTPSEGDWVAATGVLAQRNVSTTNTTRISAGLIPTDFEFDQRPPSTEARLTGTQGEGSWFRSQVNVSFDATDDLSGVDATLYRTSGTENWRAYNGTVTLGHGVHAIEYYSRDRAGKTENVSEITVPVDRERPNATANGTDLIRREVAHPVTGQTVEANASVPVVIAAGNTSTNATLRDGLSGVRSARFVIANETACHLEFSHSGALHLGPGEALVQCLFEASRWKPGVYNGTWLVTDVAGNKRFEGSPQRDVLVVVSPGPSSAFEADSTGSGLPEAVGLWLAPISAIGLAGRGRTTQRS